MKGIIEKEFEDNILMIKIVTNNKKHIYIIGVYIQ